MWMQPKNTFDRKSAKRPRPAGISHAKRKVRSCALTILIAAASQVFTISAASAEPWKKVAGWTLVGSAETGSCTMATKYTSGAYLFLSANYAREGEKAWEIFVGDKSWGVIQGDAEYPIDLYLLGTDQEPLRRVMRGQETSNANGLVASFSESSDFSSFISNGIKTASHIALVFDGKLMGAFSLNNADTAYEELLQCYDHFLSLSGLPGARS